MAIDNAVRAHALRDLEHLLLGLRGRVSITAGPASRQKLAAGRLGRLEGGRERVDPRIRAELDPAAGAGVGEVRDAVRAHALGDLQPLRVAV